MRDLTTTEMDLVSGGGGSGGGDGCEHECNECCGGDTTYKSTNILNNLININIFTGKKHSLLGIL